MPLSEVTNNNNSSSSGVSSLSQSYSTVTKTSRDKISDSGISSHSALASINKENSDLGSPLPVFRAELSFDEDKRRDQLTESDGKPEETGCGSKENSVDGHESTERSEVKVLLERIKKLESELEVEKQKNVEKDKQIAKLESELSAVHLQEIKKAFH